MPESQNSATLGTFQRGLIATVLGLALVTFFLPLVRTSTTVLGRTNWSPLQILQGDLNGSLPVLDKSNLIEPLRRTRVSGMKGFELWYVNGLVILVMLFLFPKENVIAALAGFMFAVTAAETLFGQFRGSYQQAIYGLPAAQAGPGNVADGNITAYIFMAAFAFAALLAKWSSLDQPGFSAQD